MHQKREIIKKRANGENQRDVTWNAHDLHDPSKHAFQTIHCLTSAVSMGTITTSLLEGCGWCIDTNIHTVLFGRGRSHLNGESRQLSVGEKVIVELKRCPSHVMVKEEQKGNKPFRRDQEFSPEKQQVHIGRYWAALACQCSTGDLCSCSQVAAQGWGMAAV